MRIRPPNPKCIAVMNVDRSYDDNSPDCAEHWGAESFGDWCKGCKSAYRVVVEVKPVMNEVKKLLLCDGCTENFYNGNNDLGVRRCWSFETAELVKRQFVGINDRPPWKQPVEATLHCHRRAGLAVVHPQVSA